MSKEYYFISDLHIGGDEALGVCDLKSYQEQFLLASNNSIEILSSKICLR